MVDPVAARRPSRRRWPRRPGAAAASSGPTRRCSSRSPTWSSTPPPSLGEFETLEPGPAARGGGLRDAEPPALLRRGGRAAGRLTNRFVAVSGTPVKDAKVARATATSGCCAPGWPTPGSSSRRTGSGRWRAAWPTWAGAPTRPGSAPSCSGSSASGRWRRRWPARWARTRSLSDLAEVARLCKADLGTGMVGEFPELQGIMGGHYARLEGLTARDRRRHRGSLQAHRRLRGDAARRPGRAGRAGRPAPPAGGHHRGGGEGHRRPPIPTACGGPPSASSASCSTAATTSRCAPPSRPRSTRSPA